MVVNQGRESPQVLAVRADLPIETLEALLAAAKAAPEDVSIATPGVTTSGNLGSLMLENQAGVDFTVGIFSCSFGGSIGGWKSESNVRSPFSPRPSICASHAA